MEKPDILVIIGFSEFDFQFPTGFVWSQNYFPFCFEHLRTKI